MVSLESWLVLCYLILGTWATSAGAAVLNQVMERRHDAKMARTKNRPLVMGKIAPMNALVFGMVLSLCGCVFIYFFRLGKIFDFFNKRFDSVKCVFNF